MDGPITETASFATNGVTPTLAIVAIALNPNFTVTLIYAATPGFAYHVESTSSLNPPGWAILTNSITNATSGTVSFTDTNAPGNPQLFYRVGSP